MPRSGREFPVLNPVTETQIGTIVLGDTPFKDEEEAIAIANGTPNGPDAYLQTGMQTEPGVWRHGCGLVRFTSMVGRSITEHPLVELQAIRQWPRGRCDRT